MTHVRLEHATREDLPFYTTQQDSYQREADADITREIASDRAPLIHTKTRVGQRTIRGRVTGLRSVRDGGFSDPQQALATYADRLEAHVDEFQGVNESYTLVDDQLDYSKNGMLESIEWSLSPGQIYSLDYEATFRVGEGTVNDQPTERRNPEYDEAMDVYARVGGYDLPNMRDYQMSREMGLETNAVASKKTAENNDIVVDEGWTQRMSFEGEHIGTLSERENADKNLKNLLATDDPVTLETKFPGYSLEGFVLGYESELRQELAGNSHRFRLEFVVGQRA